MKQNEKTALLLKKGVTIPVPESVFIDDDVDLSRISGDGVTIHPGCRIMGKETLLMPGVSLGLEAPVTLDNVLVGPDTRLNGGFFQGAVFAGRNTFGSGAHVRGGTILEEEACAAHTVGLKQTILFPFVTLGSLINFCDCLMAGGTSRKDHSEVGSSFIHFNYTPNQDKATPSMLGNVHQGVMLNRRPVFLGGQGGLVGPCTLPFGTVTAAGTIWRKDVEGEGKLLFGGGMKETVIPRREGIYTGVERIFISNYRYIAALISLIHWYRHVRSIFVATDFERLLLQGMTANLEGAVHERMKRLKDFVSRLELSKDKLLAMSSTGRNPAIQAHDLIMEKWPAAREVLLKGFKVESSFHGFADSFDQSLSILLPAVEEGIKVHGRDYVRVIQNLEPSCAVAGSLWLESIDNTICNPILQFIR